MSSDQYLNAVDWNVFLERYNSLVNGEQEHDDYFEGCDLEMESLDFDYDAGRCLSEEFNGLRARLTRDELYFFHHFLFLIFPHYLCDNELLDDRFKEATAFDAEPSEEHSEVILCMLNPDSVSLGNRLFQSLDLKRIESVAEETWLESDYFSDHKAFVRFLSELGDYFHKTHLKSGGLIGHVWF